MIKGGAILTHWNRPDSRRDYDLLGDNAYSRRIISTGIDLIHEGITTCSLVDLFPRALSPHWNRPDSRRDYDLCPSASAFTKAENLTGIDLIHEGITTLPCLARPLLQSRYNWNRPDSRRDYDRASKNGHCFSDMYSDWNRPDSRRDYDLLLWTRSLFLG